jgi:uroporphyrinogen-III decarboxylase
MWNGLGLNYGIDPFDYKVIEDTPEHVIARHSDGVIRKSSKVGECISQDIEPFLKDRQSWNEFKKRYEDKMRGVPIYPADWKERKKKFNNRDFALCFMGGSLFAWPRMWMTLENLSLMQYEDPALLEEIIEYIAQHFMTTFERAVKEVEFDFVYLFEDCCFSAGPLMSPESFKSIWFKHYKTLIDFYRAHGVKHILLDSDGKTDQLIPMWLEAGVDIAFPIEVGTWKGDVNKLRAEFGKDLRMLGGVDKLVISHGEAAIRKELQRVEKLARGGGYIPIPDHRIPPDVSLKDMQNYCRIFREIFG